MNLIKESEIFKWAETSKKRAFLSIDPTVQSYFEDSDIGNIGIEEYDFKNIPELIHMIEKYSTIGTDKYAQLCAVEAFRNKPHVTEVDAAEEKQVAIPDFVYVF